MGDLNRRNFLKVLGIAGATVSGIPSKNLLAEPNPQLSEDRMGVLVDTTVCIGCRRCEWACKVSHNLPAGDIESYSDESVFKIMRRPGNDGYTKVNRYTVTKDPQRPINVKVQCMHCDEPACVSACIVGAITKKKNGAVVWDTDKCIGCRYCLVACPFQIPTFEYDVALYPDIHKCDFCFERTKDGSLPACVEICPVEALTYGKRRDLVKVAEKRIQLYPDRYVNKIYGFTEVAGNILEMGRQRLAGDYLQPAAIFGQDFQVLSGINDVNDYSGPGTGYRPDNERWQKLQQIQAAEPGMGLRL